MYVDEYSAQNHNAQHGFHRATIHYRPRQHATGCSHLIARAISLVEQLDRLSQPVFQASIIAIFGLLCLCMRRYRLSIGLFASALFWLWLCCTPAFAIWLQRSLESQYPPEPVASYPKADAIVILGGGELPRPNHDWCNEKADARTTRLGNGLQLYRNSRSPIILLTGGDREATQMANWLRQQGISISALRIEDASTSTHQNALYSATLLKRERLQSILLVTSVMHMPRAASSFRQQGLNVIPAPALDSAVHDFANRVSPWWPQRAALYLSTRCLREYFGLWGYKLRGWA